MKIKISVKLNRLTVILIILFLCGRCLTAQENHADNNWYLEGRFLSGEIKKHDEIIQKILDKGTARLFDLRLGCLKTDSSVFAVAYNYPSFGIGLTVADFSSVRMNVFPYGENSYTSSRLGNIYALYGFFDQTLIRMNFLRLSCNSHIGIAYNTDIYNLEENRKKYFSNLPVMIYAGFEAGLYCSLSSRLECGINAKASHYSNGRLGIINKGINILGADIALRYSFLPKPAKFPRINLPAFKRYWYFHISAGGGLLTCYEDLKITPNLEHYPMYQKYSVTADALYRFSRIYGGGIGIDFFYVPSTASFKEYDRIVYGEKASKFTYCPFSTGVSLNQELYYQDLALTVSFGCYLYRKLGERSEDENMFYQRAGLRYYLPKVYELFFGVAIKAHYFSKAEYLEFSTGKRF
ncbi:MAG: hypothetical protein LBH32_09045 [Dysgonamonadaceae bacterium]|nr:hypothetical protein [Dysgonamonadaceae bacterium]